jgi:hypothetical protein
VGLIPPIKNQANQDELDYKTIPVTLGKVALVDAEDYDMLIKYKWTTQKSRRNRCCACRYPGPRSDRKAIYMHRVIMEAGPSEVVDHVNGDALDNRRANLRKCTNAENQRNIHARRSASGYKGVTKIQRGCNLKRPWAAAISIGCAKERRIHLGYFADPADAARAYDKAAKKHFGQFANLNYPETETIAHCLGCNCTDVHACDTILGPCFWIKVDYQAGIGVCSECDHKIEEFEARVNAYHQKTGSRGLQPAP